MLRATILPLAILIGVSAAAQNTAAKPPGLLQQQDTAPATILPTGRISGIVILSDTRKPGRGVRVNISRSATPGQHDAYDTYVMTGIDGRYQFDHLKPGDYLIRVNTNGYLYLRPSDPASHPNPSVPQSDTTTASESITLHTNEAVTFDVTLQPSASLSGYVYYDDGSPAINAEIRVEQIDSATGKSTDSDGPSYTQIARFGNRGIADEHGYFRITTLGTGTYRVAAVPMFQNRITSFDFSENDLETEMRYPYSLTIFSGDTIHRAQAKTYKLRPGDDVSDIRITIPLAGFYKVRGTASVADGRTPNKGLVTLVDVNDRDIHFRTELNTDGSFAFETIPSGTYKLTLSHLYIAGPDRSSRYYNEGDTELDSNAFSSVDSSVIVKNSDILDLHFEVHEIPLPPKPPDDDDPGS